MSTSTPPSPDEGSQIPGSGAPGSPRKGASPASPDPLASTGGEFVAACSRTVGVARGGEALTAYRRFHREGLVPSGTTPALHPVGQREIEGGTIKFTLRLPGDVETESVLIPMRRRDGTTTRTLCVSSQVGCAMGCRFCETAQMGLVRHLSTADIVAQWHAATHVLGHRPKNIVFMGMGEPTDNLDAVIPAIRVLTDHDGPAIPAANISVSTVGNPDGIRRLGELAAEPGFHRLNLAVSLNAPNDRIRAEIMPVDRAWPMDDLMRAMLAWPGRPRSAICVEYVLIPGVNDAPEHCDQVCEYLSPLRCSLNVIPYNPRRDSPWPAPTEASVGAFLQRAISNGQFTKRRGTKGRDVMAACGQLGNPEIRARRRVSDGARVGLTHESVELD
ncbi:MAG: 23S rRNA (adenine(2503)-C(2))-methyltransferase RlmN [Planctomycetota bacterium]|nr:23S rRNA (adenine(2503)-C(2))-methyltransferase RlmN [Planctomycetota bacterium]